MAKTDKRAGKTAAAEEKTNGAALGFETKLWQAADKMRNRRAETLFIDARKLGTMIDRVHRELTDDDIAKIADTYHRWRGDGDSSVGANGRSPLLTPGRYVGAEEVEDDGEPFDEKMTRLVAKLEEQFVEGTRLEKAIRKNLRGLGYGT